MNRVPLLAVVMMAKNEETNIGRSIQSLVDPETKTTPFARFILYDTGSTDRTIEVAKEECAKIGVEILVLQGRFVNFSVSRNVLLDYAADKAKWIVLMDANDELRGVFTLPKFLATISDRNSALNATQEWKHSSKENMKFKNKRVLRADRGWRFKGGVHEYICEPDLKLTMEEEESWRHIPDSFIIYQDRTLDTTQSSQRRYIRDYRILLQEHIRNPNDHRTMFYAGQTCKCLGWKEKALYWYAKRATAPPEKNKEGKNMRNFSEEIYNSYLEMAKIWKSKAEYRLTEAEAVYHPVSFKYPDIENVLQIEEYVGMLEKKIPNYPYGYDHKVFFVDIDGEPIPPTLTYLDTWSDEWWKRVSQEWMDNAAKCYYNAYNYQQYVDPLIGLVEIFDKQKNYPICFMLLKEAMTLDYPTKAQLWVDRKPYDYDRYYWMSRIAFYVGKNQDGLEAARIIHRTDHSENSLMNLNCYLKRLGKPELTSVTANSENTSSSVIVNTPSTEIAKKKK